MRKYTATSSAYGEASGEPPSASYTTKHTCVRAAGPARTQTVYWCTFLGNQRVCQDQETSAACVQQCLHIFGMRPRAKCLNASTISASKIAQPWVLYVFERTSGANQLAFLLLENTVPSSNVFVALHLLLVGAMHLRPSVGCTCCLQGDACGSIRAQCVNDCISRVCHIKGRATLPARN